MFIALMAVVCYPFPDEMMEVAMATIFHGELVGSAPGGDDCSRHQPRHTTGSQRLPPTPCTLSRAVVSFRLPEDVPTPVRRDPGRPRPGAICDRLLGFDDTPVLLCFERAADIQSGVRYCHCHLVAQWLEDRLGIEVPEVGYPNLDRFAFLRRNGISVPSYREHSARRAAKDRRPTRWS